METHADLPVQEILTPLQEALAAEGSAVLVAPPGAGKTTLVPLALLEAGWLGEGKIVVLEPRRLAARAAARRMATLLGEEDAGGTVGYRTRMDTRVSQRTRVEVVTEGVLTRMLLSDPGLAGVGAVLFDEFHERSLPADLGLALTLQARSLLRPDLRVLVMSATLDAEPVARLLGGDGSPAPILRSEGRAYPVETRWLERRVEGWIEDAVARQVRVALDEEEGDVLVFLPGTGEIRRLEERLREGLPPDVDLFSLHGSLPRELQDRAISPSPPGRRKVVLASAVAETSLTIEGVRVVVDAGLMRVPRFDPGSGMTRLDTLRVTRDSADQRRGRAGRTAPGVCYRLWTQDEDRGLVATRSPEIQEADLAPLALELAAWGAEPEDLRWMTPPPTGAYAQARELLRELELLDPKGALTPHGQEVARLGTHPRLGHLLVRGRERGAGRLAALVAALLGERDIFFRDGGPSDADLRLRLEALRRGGGWAPGGHRVDRGGVERIRKEARQWERSLGMGSGSLPPEELEGAGALLALAYPDRVGRSRGGGAQEQGAGRFLLRNGRGAQLPPTDPLSREDWIVAVELEGSGREARIFRAAPLEGEEVEELFGSDLEAREEVSWDAAAGRVVARRVQRLGAIVVTEGHLRDPDPDLVARALLAGIREGGLALLAWNRESIQLRERLAFLHRLEPEEWPDASEEGLLDTLEEWLLPFLGGVRSVDQLARVPLEEALLSPLPWELRGKLDRWAPTHLGVPSGSSIFLDYSDPEAPVLAARLQELFGMSETPRIGGGQVPLTIHLLSPARRPVQVTRDLASFWADGYFQVRKELRGRYPKHYWPDDPVTAQATRRVKPRGG